MKIPTLTGKFVAVMAMAAALSSTRAEWSPDLAPNLQGFQQNAENELQNDILPFWIRHTPDQQRGGFFGEITNDLKVHPDADRGTILTSRILWTFSTAYRKYHDVAYLGMAKRAYTELNTKLWDKENGGYYWSVAPDGKPQNRRKQVYAEVFAIYGLSEYFRASGEKEALDRAIAVYRLVEAHAFDPVNGGYFEAFTPEWKMESSPMLSAMELIGPKSQNTHLHVLEAYTNLLRVWPDPGLHRQQRALVEVMLTRVLNQKTHHLNLYCTADWEPRSDRISFGHDIEFSWLITEAAEGLGDPDLIAKARAVSVEVARTVLAQGVDKDGGLLNEADQSGLIDTNKDWWPQAESVVGFLNAYQVSRDDVFLAAAEKSWAFIDAHLIDKKYGEWFSSVARDGTVRAAPKVSFWKCPYHNGRACFEVIERVNLLKEGSASEPAHQ